MIYLLFCSFLNKNFKYVFIFFFYSHPILDTESNLTIARDVGCKPFAMTASHTHQQTQACTAANFAFSLVFSTHDK